MGKTILEKIGDASSAWEAAQLAREESVRCGSVGGTFHVAPPQASQVGPNVYIGIWGYGDAWQSDYLDPKKRAHDPIPDRVMRMAHAAIHAEVIEKIDMTPEERQTVQHFHAERQHRTLGIPAYGPFDLDFYMSVTLPRDFGPDDQPLISHLVAVGEICNRRIGQILGGSDADDVALSARETEVLSWMARGKSNSDIATILDVSPATVDTYVRRVFAKLEVYDRISASLKGVRLGLVRL